MHEYEHERAEVSEEIAHPQHDPRHVHLVLDDGARGTMRMAAARDATCELESGIWNRIDVTIVV